MKNVMTIAWGIAKEAVVKFGGKAKEYFAEALKMAWASVKEVVFNPSVVVPVAIQRSSGFVGIPASVKVDHVVDGSNHVITALPIKNDKGQEYNVYEIMVDFEFSVDVKGVSHMFKMIKGGKIFYNGVR